ncbi:ladderlectin-like [Hippoglossus hippoglossus]|uniref:ladderlectin-like n=1 Tax=Hippoglossus hippoglossus TaxID=8267 RepID=UPI00148C9CF7|nr:ladderlectin-like [Hippoglossus hippoglossus]
MPLRCPNGWTYISGRCYYYVSAKLNWAEAEVNCLTMNANLASVHSSSEYRSIQRVITKGSKVSGRTWIGGTDCQIEGIWLWSDGTAFDYRHCGVFDNRHSKQHCALMNYGDNKCWDDEKCSEEFPSVCATNRYFPWRG